MSKITERISAVRVQQRKEEIGILQEDQFGFRHLHSTASDSTSGGIQH